MNNIPDISDSLLSMAVRYSDLTECQRIKYPESYNYIWAKCSLMMAVGFDKYASQDYFYYPLSEWITNDFIFAMTQILDQLRGTKESPIEFKNEETISNLLLSVHFRQISSQMIGDIIEVEAHHLIEDDAIKLYFKELTFL